MMCETLGDEKRMSDWFTVDRLAPDTFAISEYKHWEETHCYLLCGHASALLIDTGLGIGNIKEVTDLLTSLSVLVATTHVHWDHIGGHRYYKDFAVHDAERFWLADSFPLPLSIVKHNLICKPCDFPLDFDLGRYQIFQGTPQRILQDEDTIDLGSRVLTVLHTPGHSPGHCCFYEPERGYLFSGDLIYSGCLDAFYPTTDPILFWKSVQKVRNLNIGRVFPGHHRMDIPVSIISEIESAFRGLSEAGNLEQGAGTFDFGTFQIHI